MKLAGLFALLALALMLSCGAADEPAVETLTHRITGLCCPERVEDLKNAVKDQPEIKLVDIDYAHAEATFTYAPKVFSTERLRQLLAGKAFGIKPTPAPPADQLTSVEIPIYGLDCKACSLGAYNAVIKVAGVEQATASFKEGRVTALIDPAKTNRAALEEALKKARVPLERSNQ